MSRKNVSRLYVCFTSSRLKTFWFVVSSAFQFTPSVAAAGRCMKMTKSRSCGSFSSTKLPSSHWNPGRCPGSAESPGDLAVVEDGFALVSRAEALHHVERAYLIGRHQSGNIARLTSLKWRQNTVYCGLRNHHSPPFLEAFWIWQCPESKTIKSLLILSCRPDLGDPSLS